MVMTSPCIQNRHYILDRCYIQEVTFYFSDSDWVIDSPQYRFHHKVEFLTLVDVEE